MKYEVFTNTIEKTNNPVSKKLFISLLFLIAFAACRRGQPAMPTPPGNKIFGKWTIVTVTVIPRDSTGKAINDSTVYPEPSYYYFQFNTDLTWLESLTPDLSPAGESGTYTLQADTGFTLINKNLPAQPEPCKIVSLMDTSLVFSHQRTTLFNGITPGFLEYVFQLKK